MDKRASIIGLISNVILAVFKIVAGIFVRSDALVADGVNNASDSLNTILTYAGVRLANKKADKEHPFGHQRYEYIISLIISIIMVVFGIELIRDGISNIINGVTPSFNIYVIVGICVSIVVKLLQSLYYRYTYRNTKTMEFKILTVDSMFDVITCSLVLISSLVYHFTGFNLDSYVTFIVSVIIIFNGLKLSSLSIKPLLGTITHKEEIIKIIKEIKSYPGVINVHDVIFHTYGDKNMFLSLHIELDESLTFTQSHEIADSLESIIKDKFHIDVLIHTDPIELHNKEIERISIEIRKALDSLDLCDVSFHEVRIVKPFKTNRKVIFDLEFPPDFNKSEYDTVVNQLNQIFSHLESPFLAVINCEENYFKS